MEHSPKKRDFGWLAEVAKPTAADPSLVARCRNAHDAILLTWNLSKVKRTKAGAAEILQMPKSHLSNILSGKKYLPDELRVPFMFLCGNAALRQWEDAEFSRLGVDMELIDAEKLVAELRARRAA